MRQSNQLTSKFVKQAQLNGVLDKIYNQEVNRLIRTKYSQSEELAIHRHHFEKQNEAEWDAYNAFCEECKVQARTTIDVLLNE